MLDYWTVAHCWTRSVALGKKRNRLHHSLRCWTVGRWPTSGTLGLDPFKLRAWFVLNYRSSDSAKLIFRLEFNLKPGSKFGLKKSSRAKRRRATSARLIALLKNHARNLLIQQLNLLTDSRINSDSRSQPVTSRMDKS